MDFNVGRNVNLEVKPDITALSDDDGDASFGVVNAAIVATDAVSEHEQSQAACSSPGVKADITVLSDDEALVATSDPVVVGPQCPALPLCGRTSKARGRALFSPAVLRGNLLKLKGKLCGCSRRKGLACSCFQQFSADMMEDLVRMIVRLRKLRKFDMNREARLNEGSE